MKKEASGRLCNEKRYVFLIFTTVTVVSSWWVRWAERVALGVSREVY